MIKKFKALLQEVAQLPMQKQEETLNERFKERIGDREQIDDVIVIGVRIL